MGFTESLSCLSTGTGTEAAVDGKCEKQAGDGRESGAQTTQPDPRAVAITCVPPGMHSRVPSPISAHPCPLAWGSCSLLSHLTFPKHSSLGTPGYNTSLRTPLSQVKLSNSPMPTRCCSAFWLHKLGQPCWVRGSRSCGALPAPQRRPQID